MRIHYIFIPLVLIQLSLFSQSSVLNNKVYFHHIQPDTKDSSKFNLVGLLSALDLKKFPLQNQYQHYVDTFRVNISLLEQLKKNKDKEILIFAGIWWCGDTRDILGKLQFYIDKSRGKYSSETHAPQIQIIGLDRMKKGVSEMSALFKIERVPTIIIFKEGKEMGRIVEQGQSGDWENELAQLLKYEK